MTVTSRTALRRLRSQILRPSRFVARAWRSGGPERDAVLQAAKAAVAAILAWTVSRWLLRAPQPFLAPYVAVFLVVQATVWRSVRDAGQQAAQERQESRASSDDRPPERADTAALESPDPLFVVSFADLLDHLSGALAEIREDPEALSPWAERHPPGTEALELMDRVHRDAGARLPGASGEVRTGWSAEGALLSAAQRAVGDLTGRRPGSGRG